MTRRALLLAAALAWPGAGWGQTCNGTGRPCAVIVCQTLTGSGEYLVPPDVTRLLVKLIGAGGNGSSDGTSGGDGAMVFFDMPVEPGQRIPYSVGEPGGTGQPGGNTRFGDRVAYGGGSQPLGDGAKGTSGAILVQPVWGVK